MSCTSLRADTLFGCLQGVCWEQSGWKEIKSDIVLLATSLSNYADYLVKQCDAMKHVHSSQQPVHQISENPSFGYDVKLFHCAFINSSKVEGEKPV